MICVNQIGCDHEWKPSDPMIEWQCQNCLARRDGLPKDGPDQWAIIVRHLARFANHIAAQFDR